MDKKEFSENSSIETEIEILNKAYKGADMGVIALQKLLTISNDGDFCQVMQKHLNGYLEIKTTLAKKIGEKGKLAKGTSDMASSMLKMSIITKTAMDKSTKKLSKMALLGTNMGIIEMYQIINSCKLLDDYDYMQSILNQYETFATELKSFL